ncbi:RNA-directed DNA polymerase, eukaryota [Tanacetum coccineum]
MVSFDVFVVKNLWGNMLFDFATSSARGRSGGILCVWDKLLFHKKKTYATEHCLCVEGTWMANNADLLFISVYSPQELSLKRVLWNYMLETLNRWHGEVIIMGDFNEVRFASERHGSYFHSLNAAEFNMFIANSQLIDIPLGGYSFTWSDKHASKMSKLDRFLVSQGMLDLFPNLTGLILHRHLSDHRPILLKETHVDYGPTPFRLYHSWFLEDDFHSVIEDSWNNDGISASNSMILLKNKLNFLKQRLKEWSSIKRRNKDHDRKVIQDSLIEIDLRLDKGICHPDDLTKRANLFRDLKDIDHKDSIDLAQKAKIKWPVEGDENSNFFHGIVNKKRRHLAIKGILVKSEWIENPNPVKSEFYSYYSNLFSAPAWDRFLLDDNFPRRLDTDQAYDLEDMVSNEEIKRVVWDYGSNKSYLRIFKKFWTIIGGDMTNATKEFFISSSFPKGCNSSFIALIPKVMDAKHLKDFRPISLIGCQYKIIGKNLINPIFALLLVTFSVRQQLEKEQLLMFKVNFQKAFDSVRWDHLDDILGKFGFGNKWRGWIHGCLQSSKASVLVNGSPTDEFSFHRGLRQGDPLSPFLFILVMESLHVSFQRLIDRGMFDPIFLGKENRVPISHLFYADDAMFIGKWSRSNVNVLMMMLHCFFLASGLKVNVHKSSIYGVGVRSADVQHMAENFGCISNNLPFTYLGVKVGANMMRLNSWSDVVKKVSNKLSNWKAKTLSVGGRLTLLKSVLGAIPTYYMSLFKAPEGIISLLEKMRNKFFLGADTDDRKITWVCWNKVLAHKNKGGLGVNSLFALNLASIFKWIWRFLASSSSLWIKVIKSIHGNSGALDNPYSSRLRNSTWIGILKAINKLKVKGVDLMGFCKIVIGNGSTTRFWHDIWYGDICFKEKFKRLFNLELQKDANVASKLQASNVASSFRRPPRSGIENSQFIELEQILSSISLSSVSDRWSWTLHGLGDFSVKSAREEIDKHVLVVSPSQNRWSKVLPIKLNVFSWRMMLDRLPTRSNLYNRGINITCILCPNCGAAIENRNHLFFGCSMSVDLARLIGRWWNIHIPIFDDPSSWDSWFNGMNLSSMQRRILEATFVSMWWHIWKFRNLSIFSSKKPRKERIFDDIVSHTYFWLSNRCISFNVSMDV